MKEQHWGKRKRRKKAQIWHQICSAIFLLFFQSFYYSILLLRSLNTIHATEMQCLSVKMKGIHIIIFSLSLQDDGDDFSEKDKIVSTLVGMGFLADEASSAIDRCGMLCFCYVGRV